MATNIVSHTGKNRDWICYKNGANRMTLTFTENSVAKDMSAYTFVVNIRKWGSSTNELQLTQGGGITNGGATGIVTIDLTKTQASTTLPGDSYFYEVVYTYDSKEYALLQKGLQLLAQGNSEDTTTSLSFTVTLAGASEVDVAVTLVGVTSAAIATALGAQSANVVYSGPSSGSAAVPAFRALVAGDIPDISATYLKALVTANRQTASYTLVLADSAKLVEMNVASANNLTVPPNSSVAFSTGTQILISQYGAGQTTVVAGTGVTIRSASGNLKLTGQYSGASLVKIGADEWILFGDITA
jgi:hypothetical protein